MCGIAGIIIKNTGELFTLDMLDAMAYRGPDSSDVYSDGDYTIGANRLWVRGHERSKTPIILDLEGGKSCHVVLNGQIYTHNVGAEEAQYLLSHPRLSTAEGMYAAALLVYDNKHTEMMLVRDELGIKPMYYTTANGFAFSSEIRPILTKICDTIGINYDGLKEILAWGKMLGHKTVYKHVFELEPGTTLHTNQKTIKKIKSKNIIRRKTKKQSNTIRELIQKSLTMCLDTTKRIGLAVSGGLDSTILAYELNAMGYENITTISLKISDSNDGISRLNELGLPKGGAWETWEHHVATFSPDDFPNYLNEATQLFCQPQRMTSYPMYLKLADLAQSAGIRVLLGGEGADELFMGYDSYQKWYHRRNCEMPVSQQLLDFVLPPQISHWSEQLFGHEGVQKIKQSFLSYAHQYNDMTPISALIELEKEISLQPLLLRTDICLMSRSIEGRLPFLHNKIPEFIYTLEDAQLFSGNLSKPLLREAYSECFSSYNIPKTPFRAPVNRWFSCELKNWVLSMINGAKSDLNKMGFLQTGVENLIHSIENNKEHISFITYTVISIITWYQWVKKRRVTNNDEHHTDCQAKLL